MMFNPPPTGPSGDTYSRPYDSEEGGAGTALFLAGALVVCGALAVVSLNLLLGIALAAVVLVATGTLAFYALKALVALWPISALSLAAVAVLVAGGIATADAASPSFSVEQTAASTYEAVQERATNWWERVDRDLRQQDGASPSWRTNWSGSQPRTNWGSLDDWRIKPLPTFNFGSQPSWNNNWNSNPPVYNPPPVRINPPAYNPPIYNPPRIPNPPIYNPPVFNPPMPRIPPMPVFPRY